jgi:hypothetical protein
MGQTPPSPNPTPGTETSFTMNLTPVTLPNNRTTLTGVASGIAFTITPSLDVKELNLASSNLQYYSGGFNYRLPMITKALNNVSPNVNFLALQFYAQATVGALYSNGGSTSHWGLTAGGGVDYYINNAWSFGGEADYFKFPTYKNNGLMLFVGPKLHF